MEAGGPALILLALMLVAAACLAHAMLSRSYDARQSFSAAVCVFTLPFWIWALEHCVCCYFDLGAVSFASVLVVGVAANVPAASPTACQSPIGVAFALACGFVSANYGFAMGAFCTSALLCIYFIAGFCLWGVLAVAAFRIYADAGAESSQSESLIAGAE